MVGDIGYGGLIAEVVIHCHGVLVLNKDGVVFTYTPTTATDDSFTYRVSDGLNGVSTGYHVLNIATAAAGCNVTPDDADDSSLVSGPVVELMVLAPSVMV